MAQTIGRAGASIKPIAGISELISVPEPPIGKDRLLAFTIVSVHVSF